MTDIIKPFPHVGALFSISKNGVIAKDGKMPWDLPEALETFKAVTKNCAVVIGRRAWENLPQELSMLPDRHFVVLTRQEVFKTPRKNITPMMLEGVVGMMARGGDYATTNAPVKVWVVGGGETLRQLLPYCSRAMVTQVDVEIEGGDLSILEDRPGSPYWVANSTMAKVTKSLGSDLGYINVLWQRLRRNMETLNSHAPHAEMADYLRLDRRRSFFEHITLFPGVLRQFGLENNSQLLEKICADYETMSDLMNFIEGWVVIKNDRGDYRTEEIIRAIKDHPDIKKVTEYYPPRKERRTFVDPYEEIIRLKARLRQVDPTFKE